MNGGKANPDFMNPISSLTGRLFFSVALLAALCLPALSPAGQTEGEPERLAPTVKPAKKIVRSPNGIDVGRAKVFDSRTLQLMLEAWNQQLQNQQFVDTKTVAAALGRYQGYRQRDSSSSLTITTPTLPGITGGATDTSAINTTAAGLLTTNSSQSNATTTTQQPYTPTPPTLDPFSATLPNQQYGESAGDLLSDQISLTYQIVNLRMLLDKSLSDRLLSNGSPRLQAVLGFNITINPPRIANNAAAVVEITLTPETPEQKDGVSVVALMPQEHTYNSQALSTKANAFGAAVAVKYVNIGYSQKSRDQTYFLYRDNDTVPFERAPGKDSNATTFGWMFRPVLGRPSVASENRQIFAVIALPNNDNQGSNVLQNLKVSVRTYWRRFDRNTMTSFSMDDANRRARVLYALSLTLAQPLSFDERFQGANEPYLIGVPTTQLYQDQLEPKISDISWIPTGAKSVLVTVNGENFFTETRVAVGDKILASPGDGLVIQSTETLEFTTTPEALGAAQGGAIIGRYGSAVQLKVPNPTVIPVGARQPGMRIAEMRAVPASAGSRQLDIYLQSVDPKHRSLAVSDLPDKRIILTFNNTSLPILNLYNDVLPDDPASSAVVVQTMFPESLLKNGAADVKLTVPFRDDFWIATKRLTNPDVAYKVMRLSTNTLLITADDSTGFTDPAHPGAPPPAPWKLRVGDETIPFEAPPAAPPLATPPAAAAPNTGPRSPEKPKFEGLSTKVVLVRASPIPDSVILISPRGAATVLAVPKAEDASNNKASDPKVITLSQYDSIWADLIVTDSKKVAKVMADTESLELLPPESTSTNMIKAHLTRKVTSSPGKVDLQVIYTSTNIPSTFVTANIVPVATPKK